PQYYVLFVFAALAGQITAPVRHPRWHVRSPVRKDRKRGQQTRPYDPEPPALRLGTGCALPALTAGRQSVAVFVAKPVHHRQDSAEHQCAPTAVAYSREFR